MKIKDLRLMYERCMKNIENADENAEIPIFLLLNMSDKSAHDLYVYELDDIDVVIGDDIGDTYGIEHIVGSEDAILAVSSKADSLISQIVSVEVASDS